MYAYQLSHMKPYTFITDDLALPKICVPTLIIISINCSTSNAKQKQPGCKKVRGQSEATMVISDQNL